VLKYWWSDELTALKNNAIDSNNLWIAAGKPSSGITAENRKRDKYSYKLAIKKQKKNEISGITESLYESLLTKNSTNFWTTWKSKLGSPNSLPKKVNGKGNERDIAEEFAVYFADVCTGNSPDRCKTLKDEFIKLKRNYDRTEGHIEEAISVELVDTIVNNLKSGKAAGVDQLTAENIKYSHPIIILVLAKIFKLLIMFQYVPDGFGIGVMIPIPKSDVSKDREFTCNYRGISINPIISKNFESCLLHIFSRYLTSSDLQFGFKAKSGCNHALYTVRKTIDFFVDGDATVNVCALDMSKAFDKLNRHALFIKLMNRHCPMTFINILDCWFSKTIACVKWGECMSSFIKMKSGTRQGGFKSCFLCGIY
jgi:hypothetical protein